MESTQDLAARYLEEMKVSGDTMVAMDHSLGEGEEGSYYLYDLLDGYWQHMKKLEAPLREEDYSIITTDPRLLLLKNKYDFVYGWIRKENGKIGMFFRANNLPNYEGVLDNIINSSVFRKQEDDRYMFTTNIEVEDLDLMRRIYAIVVTTLLRLVEHGEK